MKKYKYLFLTIILIIFIKNINIVINSTYEACLLFFNKVFISIFPFIILIDILLYFNYQDFLNKIFGKFLSKIFNIDSNTSIIFILSILTGSPTNSIYIKDMLDNNMIDINTANKVLIFTYFESIPFVIGTIGINLYNSLKIGLILWIFIFINNIFIGLYIKKEKNNNIKGFNKQNNNISLSKVLKNSVIKGINTSYDILGNLIIFTIIINFIKHLFKINPILLSIISGILEITNGISQVNILNINLTYKLVLTLFFLSFSGLSIIFQTTSILNKYKINIKRILIIRLVFSSFTSMIFYLLFHNFT